MLTDRDNGRYTTAYWTWDDDDQEYELVSTEHLQAIDCRAQ
ncbi:hypothetical protein [Kitasatospora purpeofusca]|nr:hypothetical protein [Kitasatospora purpeofusca]MDY0810784.1 hypothetical protein [Kitasatospora purpeofusca]